MAKLRVLQEPNSMLRRVSSEVAREDILSSKIKKLLRDMRDTLAATDIGVGLAAPQVGRPLRIFLVLENALRPDTGHTEEAAAHSPKEKKTTLAFINPRVVKASRKKVWMTEGCLSVDGKFGKIRRSEKVTVEALNEHGKKFIRGASGLLAEIIQHEADHLNGVLFIDSAKEVKKVEAEKEHAKS